MKRIIRKRVVLVLLLSLCLSLTACGNGNSGDSGNDTSVTPTRIEGMLKEAYDNTDYTSYLGLWDGVVNEGEPEQKLIAELNEDGEPRFELYVDGNLVYCGFFQIRPQYENYVYACNEYDSCGYMCWFDSYDALHIEFDLNGNSCVFVPEGTVPGWAVDTETGNGEFSDIAGIWYLDGDADAISSLEIDEQGNWTLFERLDSDDDLIEADCGYLKRDTAKEDTYYAHSRQFEDVIYDMSTDFDKEVIWWGGENDAYLLPQTTRSAGEIIEQYVGYWSDGEDFWLRIYRDGSWDTVKESGKIINRGSTVAEEDGIVLYMMDHGYVETFVLQNGSLYDADADVAYAPVMEADIPEASRTDLN